MLKNNIEKSTSIEAIKIKFPQITLHVTLEATNHRSRHGTQLQSQTPSIFAIASIWSDVSFIKAIADDVHHIYTDRNQTGATRTNFSCACHNFGGVEVIAPSKPRKFIKQKTPAKMCKTRHKTRCLVIFLSPPARTRKQLLIPSLGTFFRGGQRDSRKKTMQQACMFSLRLSKFDGVETPSRTQHHPSIVGRTLKSSTPKRAKIGRISHPVRGDGGVEEAEGHRSKDTDNNENDTKC